MRVWRICRKPHAADALSGKGGLYASGRWHTKGRRVVYTSDSLALAALELLVHVGKRVLPPDLVQIEIDLPDRLKIRSVLSKALPRNWRAFPAPSALQRRGDAWLVAGATPVLQVPSALIPEQSNFLINPAHADTGKIRVVSTKRFRYDPRVAG